MIESIKIEGYKSIDNETLIIKPLTILTGLNSTGKSTVIQSILLLSYFNTTKRLTQIRDYVQDYAEFNTVRNRYVNAKEIKIEVISQDKSKITLKNDGLKWHSSEKLSSIVDFEENLFYISANRIGQEELAAFDENVKFGTNGKYVFGYFEQNKSKVPVKGLLVKEADSETLDSQLSYWLEYILDIKLRIKTDKVTVSTVKVSFDSDGLEAISPFNLGAGNSYVAKIIIMALSCKPGNILIIENPEIHLHPKAQSMLADFLNFVSSSGVQVILETHSEHIINKTRYNIYKNNINHEDVIIHYKPSIRDPFNQISINRNGHFIDTKNQEITFPVGFFDSTLNELLEIM